MVLIENFVTDKPNFEREGGIRWLENQQEFDLEPNFDLVFLFLFFLLKIKEGGKKSKNNSL